MAVSPSLTRWAACLLPILSGISSPAATAQKGAPSPPAQSQPWKAPQTSLPPEVVSAVTELFRQGLPDPRGCEYREIEIAGTPPIKTHGWVLPAHGDTRYAIGWNGVVYPVTKVGQKVDLEKQFAELPAESRQFRGNGNDWPMSDPGSLRIGSALPIKVAYLLRAGEVHAAEQVWIDGNAGRNAREIPDPYVEMATLRLGRWYNQAIDAYLKGDYAATLAICQQISPALQQAEVTAQTRGLAKAWIQNANEESIWQVPLLQAEASRRLAEPPLTSVLDAGLPAAGSERIAALIRDLETVSVHQWSNPGETNVAEDPVVAMLVKEGESAVEPLLRCLREDERLTRSRYTAGMSHNGPIIPVYEAAYKALFRILRTSFSVPSEGGDPPRDPLKNPRHLGPEDRQALAAQLEAVWQKKAGTTPPELGYATLQDDEAGADAWFQAVGDIVQPADGTFTAYRLGTQPTGGYAIHMGHAPFAMKGEPLHAKTSPSVSELMLKRFWQLAQEPSEGEVSWNSLARLYLSFADWDGPTHPDDLRTMSLALVTRFPNVRPSSDAFLQLPAVLFEKRADLGDPGALADYAGWLQGLAPSSFGTSNGDPAGCFRLMWEHPVDPAIVQAATKLFADPASPWLPFLYRNGQRLSKLICTPLIGLPAFRQALDRGLADRATVGGVTSKENHHIDVQLANARGEDPYRDNHEDPLAPPAGSRSDFRLCDYYAWQLSQVDGFPRCELYWPEARRDQAVAACRAFLQRYGDNFRYQAGDQDNWDMGPTKVPIHFPQLDRPATPEDVAQGRAIFSLSGNSRLCAPREFPILASRPSRPEDPEAATTVDKAGKPQPTTLHTTGGRVWQAEEMLVDGKWERFFGFIGRYQCEEAPATELEFLGDIGGTVLTPELSVAIERPLKRDSGDTMFFYFLNPFATVHSALPVTIKVLNRSGLDQPLPAALALPAGYGLGLPPGLRLELSYSKKTPPHVFRIGEPPFDYGTWRDVALRSGRRKAKPTVASPEPTLSPAQQYPLLTFDLRDYFDLTRPGAYRLKVIFQLPGVPPVASDEIIIPMASD